MVLEQAEAILEQAGQQVASLFGAPFQLVRPDYTQTTAPETTIYPQINFRVDPGSDWVEPKVDGVDYYEIVGTRNIQLGDVLTSMAGLNPLTITIVSGGVGKPFYGAYTNLIGYITDGADDGARVLYSNIRFKLFTIPSLGGGLDPSVLGSLGVPNQRVLMFNARPGLQQGMWLRWTDPGLLNTQTTIPRVVRIESVTNKLNQLVLNVSDNPGRG